MKSFDQIEIERLRAEVKILRESLADALREAESWAGAIYRIKTKHGVWCDPYDDWVHHARELLQKEGQQ